MQGLDRLATEVPPILQPRKRRSVFKKWGAAGHLMGDDEAILTAILWFEAGARQSHIDISVSLHDLRTLDPSMSKIRMSKALTTLRDAGLVTVRNIRGPNAQVTIVFDAHPPA